MHLMLFFWIHSLILLSSSSTIFSDELKKDSKFDQKSVYNLNGGLLENDIIEFKGFLITDFNNLSIHFKKSLKKEVLSVNIYQKEKLYIDIKRYLKKGICDTEAKTLEYQPPNKMTIQVFFQKNRTQVYINGEGKLSIQSKIKLINLEAVEIRGDFHSGVLKRLTYEDYYDYLNYEDCGRMSNHGGEMSFLQNCVPYNSRIVGGENSFGAIPWQVSLRKQTHVKTSERRLHICGAVLIDRCYVLSAAHCFTRNFNSNGRISLNDINDYVVRVGDFNNDDKIEDLPTIEEFKDLIIEKVYIPETYDEKKILKYDIALIKLRNCATINELVRPICLPKLYQIKTGDQCIISGWGSIQEGTQNYPRCLQSVGVKIHDNNNCTFQNEVDENQMICAGGSNKDTCKGDSGGPLACKKANRFVLAGVTIGGGICGEGGIYSRISFFMKWIFIKRFFSNYDTKSQMTCK